MKGHELIKEISERKIKNSTKIKVKMGAYKATIKYENLMLKWEIGDFDTSVLCSPEAEFEVIEETKEIKELQEDRYIVTDVLKKNNELTRAVNKLIKEREEK